MIYEEAFSPAMFALLIALLLGAAGTVALSAAAVAVYVLGPRRWDAMSLPAVAAFVAMVVFVLTGSAVSPLLALVTGTLVAFLVAWLQRDSVTGGSPRAERTARNLRIAGSVLSWVLSGLAIGLVVGAATQSTLPLLLFPLVGALIALRPSAILERKPAPAPTANPAAAEDPPASAGMLDE